MGERRITATKIGDNDDRLLVGVGERLAARLLRQVENNGAVTPAT
jgi:hypothetical protein